MSDERVVGWLIEGAGVYWAGHSVHDFRLEWGAAIFFARQSDAEQVLHWILPEEYRRTCRAREHVIMEPQIG